MIKELKKHVNENCRWAVEDLNVDLAAIKARKDIHMVYLIGYRELGVDSIGYLQATVSNASDPIAALKKRYLEFARVQLPVQTVTFTKDCALAYEWIQEFLQLPHYVQYPCPQVFSIYPESEYGERAVQMDQIATLYYCFFGDDRQKRNHFVQTCMTAGRLDNQPVKYALQYLQLQNQLSMKTIMEYCPWLKTLPQNKRNERRKW